MTFTRIVTTESGYTQAEDMSVPSDVRKSEEARATALLAEKQRQRHAFQELTPVHDIQHAPAPKPEAEHEGKGKGRTQVKENDDG